MRTAYLTVAVTAGAEITAAATASAASAATAVTAVVEMVLLDLAETLANVYSSCRARWAARAITAAARTEKLVATTTAIVAAAEAAAAAASAALIASKSAAFKSAVWEVVGWEVAALVCRDYPRIFLLPDCGISTVSCLCAADLLAKNGDVGGCAALAYQYSSQSVQQEKLSLFYVGNVSLHTILIALQRDVVLRKAVGGCQR